MSGFILVAKESFSKDYLGCGIVLKSNILTIAYCKLTEIYHQITWETNIKFLTYNNYLPLPILFSEFFLIGEDKKIYQYFSIEESYRKEGIFIGFDLIYFYMVLFALLYFMLFYK